MKHAISMTMLAATLVATVPSFAQPAPPTRPVPGNGGAPATRPSPVQGRPQVQPPRPGNGGPQIQPPRPGSGGPQIQPPRPGNGGPQIQPPRPGNGGPQIQPPRPVFPQPPRPPRPDVRPPHPGNGYHPGPPGYRPGYWNNKRYYYPSGYRYQRYAVGVYLPRAFWGSSFWWINDWQVWGLQSYRPGYRWVRVGPDALLVSTRNGRIIAVRHNIFW